MKSVGEIMAEMIRNDTLLKSFHITKKNKEKLLQRRQKHFVSADKIFV